MRRIGKRHDMKNYTLRNALFLVCFFMISWNVKATHIVGGELNYRYLTNNFYQIKLTVYRDCFNGIPPFDNPASIGVFDANNNLITEMLMTYTGSDTIPPTINSPCFIPPTNICYEVTTYIDTIQLPPIPGGYQLAYQRCCRNQTILNIVNPLNTGATYYAGIQPPGIDSINSNPEFKYWPPPFICQNVPFVFDHSAIDYDGDSVVYELCTPFDGATFNAPMPQPPNNPPYNNVIWIPPYNLGNVLGGVPLLIDPVTGVLTATPNTIGQFVVGVCAREYRNGILLSTSRRDFQLNVVQCPTLLIAAIQTPVIVCGSFNVSFLNNSIGASAYHWDFGDPNTNTDTSNAFMPSYTYPDTGIYTITLVAYSSVNQGCTDTTVGYVHLVPDYVATFSYDTTACSYLVQFTDTSNILSGTTSQWQWNFGDNGFSSLHNPQHTYSSGGNYQVTLIATSALGCVDTITTGVSIPSLPEVIAQSVSGVGCYGECNGQSSSLALNGSPPYQFLWNDPYQQNTPTADSLCAGTYLLTLTDSSGCQDTVSVQISTPDSLVTGILSTDAYCNGLCIGTATAMPSGGTVPYSYQWSDPAAQTNQSAVSLCPGTYIVTVIDQHGCTVTDSVVVLYSDAHPFVDAFADDDTLFYGQSTVLNATIVNGYSYVWSPVLSISDISVPQPVASPLVTTTYTVLITDSLGCTNTDSVTIYVVIPLCDEPEIFIPNAFSPNNDNSNDQVFVRGGSIADLYFVIYNRWGEKVFETTNVKQGWDGTYKGKMSAPAVFVYYVEVTCSNKARFFKKGNITLIR